MEIVGIRVRRALLPFSGVCNFVERNVCNMKEGKVIFDIVSLKVQRTDFQHVWCKL